MWPFTKFKKNKIDMFYVEASGDIVESLDRWQSQDDQTPEASLTYSGLVFDVCKKHQLKTLAVSSNDAIKIKKIDELISAENIPKRRFSSGLGYHLGEVGYGIKLLGLALKHRPEYMHIASGATYWFVLAPLALLGIKIIPRFHNTLWPSGYPPTKTAQKILLKLDAWFLKNVATAALGVSNEIPRQIAAITNKKSCPLHVFIPQFDTANFNPAPFKPVSKEKPFVIAFSGRIEHNKGVFDILQMANQLKDENVVFHLCGNGPYLSDLKNECAALNLEAPVFIHGHQQRPDLIEIYNSSHLIIIPTRSDFPEGFAKVAAEAILLEKPILSSPVVPAIETLASATLKANTDDVASYVELIRNIRKNPEQYKLMCKACVELKEQFYNKSLGLGAIIEKTMNL